MGERGEVKERENKKIQVSCARGWGEGSWASSLQNILS
jgi:hypothetical protein